MVSRPIRTFVAIAISDDARSGINAMMESIRLESSGIRWTPIANLHLTLKFIGNIDQDKLSDLHRAISEGADEFAAFEYTIRDKGCFPNWNRPRILWVGVRDPEGTMQELHQRIEEELARAGIPKETRKFTPHLTIGRVKHVEVVKDTLSRFREYKLGEFRVRVDKIDLMKSELQQSGARYSVLHSIPLRDPHSKSQSLR